MKNKKSLINQILEGMEDLFYIWRDELKSVFHDSGVMIFFFLVPLVYPVIYSFIYNIEVAREARMVVVDQSDTPLSREFVRRINASPDVQVVAAVGDMEEAKRMVDEKRAYGVLKVPSEFSKDMHEGRQTTVSLYCDMSALLFYKAFLATTTDVSLEMGAEWAVRSNPQSTDEQDAIKVHPIPSKLVTLYNTQNGFASFLVPAILILVLQQTLILGITMAGGTAREKNRFGSLVPLNKRFRGTLRIVLGKSMVYLFLYLFVTLWVLVVVPRLFGLPQIGNPVDITLFVLPFLLGAIYLSITLSGFITQRETSMLVFVFSSVVLLFISGISWPKEAIPPFWKAVGYLFPSTMGVQGFVRLNTCGASLYDVVFEYRMLWIQVGFYFITACLIYRKQIIILRSRMLKRYCVLKLKQKIQTNKRTNSV